MANLLQSGWPPPSGCSSLLDAERQSPDPEPAATVEHLRGRVAFEHVRFGYDERPLLRDLSLVAEPGQTVAVVGPTGAGKTTLVNLLMRFHEPAGRADHPRRRRRRHDAPRRPALARRHGAAGRVGVRRLDPRQHRLRPPERDGGRGAARGRGGVRRPLRARPARRLRHARRHGRRRPQRGERQAITIARAFLADPALLVLDEATARSTPAPRCWCRRRWRRCGPTARASSSRTACRRSATPT
nr:ATP-binding cassette domain-containing protein [Angustibacter aerolatus]